VPLQLNPDQQQRNHRGIWAGSFHYGVDKIVKTEYEPDFFGSGDDKNYHRKKKHSAEHYYMQQPGPCQRGGFQYCGDDGEWQYRQQPRDEEKYMDLITLAIKSNPAPMLISGSPFRLYVAQLIVSI